MKQNNVWKLLDLRVSPCNVSYILLQNRLNDVQEIHLMRRHNVWN